MNRLRPLGRLRPSILTKCQSRLPLLQAVRFVAAPRSLESVKDEFSTLRDALDVCEAKNDWITARDIWKDYVAQEQLPIDGGVLDRFCRIALAAKDIPGAFSILAAGRTFAVSQPPMTTYQNLIAGLLEETNDSKRLAAAMGLLEELKGVGEVGDGTLRLMLRAYASAQNVKGLDALVTFIVQCRPNVPLGLRCNIVEAYCSSAITKAQPLDERVESAFKQFINVLLGADLTTISSHVLVDIGRAVTALFEYLARDAVRDPHGTAARSRDINDVLEPFLIGHYEKVSKFVPRSAELLELFKAVDLAILRTLVTVTRQLDGDLDSLSTEEDSWMAFVDRVIFRHGPGSLGRAGANAVLELLALVGDMNRAMSLFDRIVAASINPMPATYRTLMTGWVSGRVPRNLETGQKLDNVILLAEAMRAAGHPLLAEDYALMLKACLPLGYEAPLSADLQMFLEESKRLAEDDQLPSTDVRPTRRPFSPATDMDPRISLIETQFFKAGLQYDQQLVCDLLRTLCGGGFYEEAYRIVATMRNSGVRLDRTVYNCLMECSSADGAASRVALGSLRFDMKRHGHDLDGASYSALLKCCDTIRDRVTKEEIKREMEMTGFTGSEAPR